MPVPITKPGAGGDTGDRVQLMERELGKLRRDMEGLRQQSSGESHRGAMIAWMALAAGALGLVMGLLSLVRH